MLTHIDSLRRQLVIAKDDSNKVKLLLKLGQTYLDDKQDSLCYYDELAQKLALKIHYPKGIARSYYDLGDWYFHRGGDWLAHDPVNNSKAEVNLRKAADISFGVKDYAFAWRAAGYAASAVFLTKKTRGTVSYLQDVADLFQNAGQEKYVANAYMLIGDYSMTGLNYTDTKTIMIKPWS